MATEDRGTDPAVTKRLFDEPYRFDFFQAVRLLERIDPERSPVGRDSDPRRDAARFRTRASLNFPPSQIYQIRNNGLADDTPPEVMVAFMGLTGPLGVLPQHFTELVAERARYGDTALWEFFDIFNHRMISLFYRVWEKHRLSASYDRKNVEGNITDYLFDIIGMGTKGLQGRLSVPDHAMLLYGGLIAQRPHSAGIVAAILGDYFNVPAHVEQFGGQWLELEDEDCSRLGTANNQLGVNTIAGQRIWDNQSKFRAKFGPLTFEKFKAFLPAGSAFQPAGELVRFLAGMEFDFDIQLALKADHVPDCVLGTHADARPMLGWTTWLKTRAFTKDDSQVVLAINN